MKITKYLYNDNDKDLWRFECFQPRSLNLIVGQSSAGKSRLLNSIFSLGASVVRNSINKLGHWWVDFEQANVSYTYELHTVSTSRGLVVKRELLKKCNGGDDPSVLIDREGDNFIFCGTQMPRLPVDQSSIHLLAEEPEIQPIKKGFESIRQRQFDKGELESSAYFAVVDSNIEKLLKQSKSIEDLFGTEMPLSLTLHYLKEHFPVRFNSIVTQFREVFPSVQECDVYRLKREEIPFETKGVVPNFAIKEKGVKTRISLRELSSGMKKVLLILTDIASSPDGTVYLLDEYENSLGVNAIDFLPSFISEYQSAIQFFITTHHPYLINEIPIENWFLLSRTGSKVKITSGIELKERYGKSKHEAFIQLLNDPLYTNS